jgi:hypothetical protein
MIGLVVSPLLGAEGNVEFLAHLRPSEDAGTVPDEAVRAVVDEVAQRLAATRP